MLDVLHDDYLSKSMKGLLEAPRDQIKRRVLPMRIEPSAELFPTMTGLPVLAEDAEIATVLEAYRGLRVSPCRSDQMATGTRFRSGFKLR